MSKSSLFDVFGKVIGDIHNGMLMQLTDLQPLTEIPDRLPWRKPEAHLVKQLRAETGWALAKDESMRSSRKRFSEETGHAGVMFGAISRNLMEKTQYPLKLR